MSGNKLSRFACLLLLLATIRGAQPADFAVYDVYVDSKEPLAAYQIRIESNSQSTKIISVEGGEHSAFKQPPFYDPKAIQNHVIKLAAFSTAPSGSLPVGRTRIASLHLQADKPWPEFSLRVEAAATAGGKKIRIEPAIRRRSAEASTGTSANLKP